jgi:hypothetical protein
MQAAALILTILAIYTSLLSFGRVVAAAEPRAARNRQRMLTQETRVGVSLQVQ